MMLQAQLPFSATAAATGAGSLIQTLAPSGAVKEWLKSPQRPASSLRTHAKVTEVIIQDDDDYDYELLLPLFERVSRDNRWLAWVAPPRQARKSSLQMAGIDTGKIITLTPSERHTTYQLACQALRAGTCHVVIRWQGPLPDITFAGLQAAAREGQSQAILIRTR